ncbi:hypothetical protein F1189_18880 [Rhodovastum atsumiense]|uniref:Anti-sigma factor NepR domain-containing protein n=2 Tax=Rhodovastum atsumiense TaxID=504468 RepID=A0A5M6IRP2_9PROT|nr:hypothetical protein [Rhodovastum atsumiense]KAA5610567.1 hypothetical protein F1189_18880 [Rhodovastum atsumiense]
MTRRKDIRQLPAPPPGRGEEDRGEAAFDLWLQRGLHQLFDGIAREPIPDELLRLIEDDRRAAAKGTPDSAGTEEPEQ